MRIDLTRDDPLLPIDKVPLIIMTDGGFLLVKRQEHHRPANRRSIPFSFSLSLSVSLFPAFCLSLKITLIVPSRRHARRLNVNASDAIMRGITDTRDANVRGYEGAIGNKRAVGISVTYRRLP